MKKSLLLILSIIIGVFSSCDIGDATAYKDLVFGMSLEEVQTKGYCTGEKSITEDGLDSYRCVYTDFAGVTYEKCELIFQNNKLVKVHFYNSTFDPVYQKKISKKITDYLTSKFGPAKVVNKCDGWKDDKRTFILYIHIDDATYSTLLYVNELAIFGNDYYKPRK